MIASKHDYIKDLKLLYNTWQIGNIYCTEQIANIK